MKNQHLKLGLVDNCVSLSDLGWMSIGFVDLSQLTKEEIKLRELYGLLQLENNIE